MNTHGTRANHNNRAARVGRQTEGRPTNMDGDFVRRGFKVRISRSVDVITGHRSQLRRCRILRDQRCRFATSRIAQVVQQVAPNAVHPARGLPLNLL